jgi:hypothetical protein
MVEALKDQFVAARHQAGVKAEAARMLALDMPFYSMTSSARSTQVQGAKKGNQLV